MTACVIDQTVVRGPTRSTSIRSITDLVGAVSATATSEFFSDLQFLHSMAVLDTANKSRCRDLPKCWMAGSRPAMTRVGGAWSKSSASTFCLLLPGLTAHRACIDMKSKRQRDWNRVWLAVADEINDYPNRSF